jgi:hypothetical protein
MLLGSSGRWEVDSIDVGVGSTALPLVGVDVEDPR